MSRARGIVASWIVCLIGLGLGAESATGQDGTQQADAQVAYIDAVDLLPESTAGIVRVPNLPTFCDAWKKTQFGKLVDDEAMQPFIEAQRKRAENLLDAVESPIGLRPNDLYDIASGEVAFAWLPFDQDKRRPYAACVIADVRGKDQEVAAAVEKIDRDLKAGDAVRKDVQYGGEVIRVYTTKPKPGQLKVDQVALSWNKTRIIAADRDTVVQNVLDVVAGKSTVKPLSQLPDYQKVLEQSQAAIEKTDDKTGVVCWEWFARPFAMGRILREVFEYDRGNQLDVLALLERQGFEVVEAIGGVGVVAGDQFDILHRGLILAPGEFTKAAQMLQMFNTPYEESPGWIPATVGSFTRLNWKMEEAFWASEPMINDAVDDEIFREMIEGIKNDPEGPQIDIAKNFLPHLDDELIFLTDNTEPAGPDSDRMLVAMRLTDAASVKNVIRKAMEVEPDATKLDVAELDVWQVQRDSSDEDLDVDLELAEFGLGEDFDDEDAAPLLNHWAIGVAEPKAADGSAYLLFSSHSDFLVDVAQRIAAGKADGMWKQADVEEVSQEKKKLGVNEIALDRITRTRIAFRSRWELLRTNQLQEGDSMLAKLLQRMDEAADADGNKGEPIDWSTLPPLAKIEKYLRNGGSFWEKTADGWTLTGFVLK
ncbi:membrane or secreted protein [Stieleria varia]|uniref:membrane or secreted protein n=1 Tax=Stieleria varia TaxID=2528005 RepID=UPI0011B46DC1|nr:membrane or secreted protein [Stieleria varia]